MSVRVGKHGLYLNDEYLPIYSGTVHYWRLEPELWEPILENVKELGFRMIETYIPWGVHELAPGQFDFGTHDPRNDLPRFLELCQKIGIAVCVRPGPHINAELTWFGFPERVLADPAVCAHTATGAPAITDRLPQPFAIPSYASEKLFEETGIFYDAVCAVLKPYLEQPVVACQVDNETCYFFRTNPYDMDYSVDSLRLYRRMLCERYGSIDKLNDAYGTSYNNFESVEPPRDWEGTSQRDVPRHLDWVAYKEYQITTSLERLGIMLRERGISVPLYHDVAFNYTTPIDMAALEAQPHLDFVGTNLYANQEAYHSVISPRVRYQVGSQHLPFVPEYGAGLWWFHSRTHTPEEQEFFVLAGLMHGLKALNFYMLVERDRWQGSPITRNNLLRPGYAEFFQRLSALVEETNFFETEKLCNVLVMLNYDLNRFETSYSTLQNAYLGLLNVPAEFSLVDTDLGFKHAPETQSSLYRPHSWLTATMQTLEQAQVEYNLSDTHLPSELLSRYPLVFLPTADFMGVHEQHCLLDYVKKGGHLVIGPAVPTQDTLMNPAQIFGQHISTPGTVDIGTGKLTLVADPAQVVDSIAAQYANPVLHSNPALRLTIRQSATCTLVFLLNPTKTAQTTTLQQPQGKWRLHGVWNATGEYAGETLTLAPYSVQIWKVNS